jgi:hypothetical protein
MARAPARGASSWRGLQHSPEVRPKLAAADAEIGFAAQQNELGRVIDAREMAQEIADVGADPEIVDLPRVDGDSHELRILLVHVFRVFTSSGFSSSGVQRFS